MQKLMNMNQISKDEITTSGNDQRKPNLIRSQDYSFARITMLLNTTVVSWKEKRRGEGAESHCIRFNDTLQNSGLLPFAHSLARLLWK